jgi:hypothetical protein
MMRRLAFMIPLGFLLLTAVTLLIGQMKGAPDLKIAGNYISEFAARRDASGALVYWSMWGFGLTFVATAAALLLGHVKSFLVTLGCLCLAAGASLLPFVAEYRMWAPAPPTAPQPQNFLQRLFPPAPNVPVKGPDDVVREQVHGNAIHASLYWIATGMVLASCGLSRRAVSRKLTIVAWALLPLAALLLFSASLLPSLASLKGLVEWSSFGCLAVWVALATLTLAKADAVAEP